MDDQGHMAAHMAAHMAEDMIAYGIESRDGLIPLGGGAKLSARAERDMEDDDGDFKTDGAVRSGSVSGSHDSVSPGGAGDDNIRTNRVDNAPEPEPEGEQAYHYTTDNDTWDDVCDVLGERRGQM